MSNQWADSAIMMTLSAIAYQPISEIAWQLQQTEYATAGDWSLAWGPVQDSYGNLAYVAVSASTGAYALVVRGSLTDFSWAAFENWYYDLDVLFQAQWRYFPNDPGSMISWGSYSQASNLTAASYLGQTLASFLMTTVPASAILYVTGHSLGGNLATVLASWISAQRGPAPAQSDPNSIVYTFAAPSAGNTVFASAYNKRFPNSWRYCNLLDIVPNAWDNLLNIDDIYDNHFLYTPLLVQSAIDTMELDLLASQEAYGSWYQQTNGSGTPLGPSFIIFPKPDWYAQVGGQHASGTYLYLLGAPLIVPEHSFVVKANMLGPIMQRPRPQKGAVPPMLMRRRAKA
jgi:triacylglycerol lipase